MTTRIDLNISDELARAIVIAADRLGATPEELLEHAIWWRRDLKLRLR